MRAHTVPDISILMTALNTSAYVAEAIDSIFSQQTTRTWELLFVDDGSTDQTLAIASECARRSPENIKLITHPDRQNLGISASRNLALRHARGALTAFLDSDDVWLPHHLETQASILDLFPNVSMVYGEAERWVDCSVPFNEDVARAADWGSNYLPPLIPEGEQFGLIQPGRLTNWFRKDESMVPCICTVIVRTSIALAVGGFCDDFRGLYDDQVFHARVAQNHDVFANGVCVARYRQHEESCCARAKASQLAELERSRFQHLMKEESLSSL
jgi:glycosyltransferase involved in cell wall biosynthesis